jgi:hypothetical protein
MNYDALFFSLLNKEKEFFVEELLSTLSSLKEKYFNPFFQPYFETLPQDYSNFPIFNNDEEMKLIKNTHTEKKVMDLRVRIRHYYNT